MNSIISRESLVKEIQPVNDEMLNKISSNLVITFDKNGNQLSCFADDIWDYSATSASYRTLQFRKRINKILLQNKYDLDDDTEAIDEALIFIKTFTMHWTNVLGGCSMSKLTGDVAAIDYLVAHCVIHKISPDNLFIDANSIDFIIKNISTSKQIGIFLAKIQRFIDSILVYHQHLFWKKLQPSTEFLAKLKNSRKIFPETTYDTVQTLLIPSKIYQNLLKTVISDLENFLKHKNELEYIFSKRSLARDLGVAKDIHVRAQRISEMQNSRINHKWQAILQKDLKLTESLKGLEKSEIINDSSWISLRSSFRAWQTKCAILLAAFTGMRKNEVLAIPLNGLQYLNTNNGKVPVVWSTTTKLEKNGIPRFTKWPTSSIVEIAFDVAKLIVDGILKCSGDREIPVIDEQRVPLFLSYENGKHGKAHPQFDFTVTALDITLLLSSYSAELKITQLDVEELSWFFYGETPGNVVEGEIWPLAFHQFRRSLAVYAAASGKVSYSVLKSQLKHISMVMTAYYANSSSRAVDILSNEAGIKALRAEWDEAKAHLESEFLHDALSDDMLLAGVAGKKLQNQKIAKELPIFLANRKDTVQSIKNGKIRYRPTLVGGCMSHKPCNKGAGVLASACVSCDNAVFLPGSKAALEQTKLFYETQLRQNIPIRARAEYEENIRKIDSFMKSLNESVGNAL